MAVPDWPGTYGHNMFLFPVAEWLGGPWDLFLEHGHRLLGATVGLITLGLVAAVWRLPVEPRVRWLAVAALVLVVVQGGLGGARVLLDDTTVAKVHACTGPLFFAVAVALAALTRGPPTVEVPRVAIGLATPFQWRPTPNSWLERSCGILILPPGRRSSMFSSARMC